MKTHEIHLYVLRLPSSEQRILPHQYYHAKYYLVQFFFKGIIKRQASNEIVTKVSRAWKENEAAKWGSFLNKRQSPHDDGSSNDDD